MSGPGSSFDWAAAIAERALEAGIELPPESVAALAAHAVAVLERNPILHLTSLRSPAEFVERHVGESLEGAALIPPALQGALVDLGSGNGYPGIPIAVARPHLKPTLVEASVKKAQFLQHALAVSGIGGTVLQRQVVRSSDLTGVETIEVLATRAMGGWERVVPKLASRLASEGLVLLWTTADTASITARDAWRGLELVQTRALPGRERSRIVVLRRRS